MGKGNSFITIIDIILKTEHAIDVENPLCPNCGKKMHLTGKGRSIGAILGIPVGIGGGMTLGAGGGAAAGAAAGAKLFAFVGTAAGGPIGAVAGAAVGAITGTVFGAFMGHMYDKHIRQEYRCPSCNKKYVTK